MNTIIADLHTHTIGSLHAHSTLKENITEAENKYIEYIAVTDHLYNPPYDLCQSLNEEARITDINYLKQNQSPYVRLIPSVEANIAHKPTNAQNYNKILKWRLVGHHSWFCNPSEITVEDFPFLFADTITDETLIRPTAFAHIERTIRSCNGGKDDSRVRKALCGIVKLAVESDIFLEINEYSLLNPDNVELMKYWMNYAKMLNAKFCLGSDAHYCDAVGDFTKIEKLFETVDMSNEYILNCDRDALSKLAV